MQAFLLLQGCLEVSCACIQCVRLYGQMDACLYAFCKYESGCRSDGLRTQADGECECQWPAVCL